MAISCVGRRLVLGPRVEEEIESVAEGLPASAGLIGYYSYGEISPLASGRCDQHNQTMTLTCFWERA
ncbi:MAG: FIST C-terminal domain-containing protein [Candidatus Sedimenticola endophacoides]